MAMIKKIIIGFLVFFILIVGAIVAIPFLFKEQINDILKEQINNELKVSVDYSDYDLSIISSFPDLKFSLNNLLVIGQGVFEGDTLAMMKTMDFNLDAMKIYKERELQIHSIYINELNLKAYILEDSTSSLDVLKDKPKTETTAIDTSSESLVNMQFESLIVENSNIYYKNDLNNQVLLLNDLNIDASADYKDEKAAIDGNTQIARIVFLSDSANKEIELNDLDLILTGNYFKEKLVFDTKTKMASLKYNSNTNKQNIDLKDLEFNLIGDYLNGLININSQSKIASFNFLQEETKFFNNAKINLNGDIIADLNTKEYTFNKNILKFNDLSLAYDGNVKMPSEDIAIDLNFATNESTFKNMLSIVPEKYLSNFKDTDVKGTFDLKGFVKGVYNSNSYPSFDVNMGISKGYFKNKSLPTAVENINLQANVKSPNYDMSQMDLNIPNATFTVENEPIVLSLKMLDIKNDAFVDLKAKGKLDLEKVPDFYEIKDLKKIDGNVDMDIAFKGKLSDVEKKNFNKVDFQGDMKIKDLVYNTKSTERPINVKTMDLDFTPQYANMKNLDMTYGKSDIKANGKLENVINYVLSDGTVKGNLNITSNKIDLTELMGNDDKNATKSTSDKESKATRVPKNIDFVTHADIKEILYDDIVLSKVKGEITLKDEAVNIKNIKAKMLGGNAKINGSYATKKVGKPVVNFKYDVKNFDIKQTFKYVNTVKQIAPIAEFLDGKFSSNFSFNSLLEDDFMPDMSLINGLGNVNISYASFLNFPIFNSISKATKIPMLDLNKAAIKNAWTIFKVKNGKVAVEPFDYKYQDIKMNISGANGFDKSIDYSMKVTVPSNKFGGAASLANNFLSKQNIPLLNLSVPKNITFHLNISGFLNNPKVKILKITSDGSDKGIVESVTDGIKDKAKEEADKLAKQAEERMKKEAEDLLKKQAEDLLKKQTEDKLKKEAEDLLKDNLPNFGW